MINHFFLLIAKNGSCKANGEGTIDVQGDAGTIHSPNYPRDHPTNMTCRWKILVSPGNVIEFTANINQLNGDCSKQWIRIYDGPDTSSPELVNLCNMTSLHTFFSSTNSIVVEFVTTGDTKSKGFYITYAARRAKPKSYACSKSRELNAASGQIASERFPLQYSNNAFCQQTIVLPKLNYRVNLTFTSLDIEPDGDKCEKDYVEIKSLGKSLARLCGKKTTPFSIISKNNNMEITFRTDASGRYPGYEATFTSVQDCKWEPFSFVAHFVSLNIQLFFALLFCYFESVRRIMIVVHFSIHVSLFIHSSTLSFTNHAVRTFFSLIKVLFKVKTSNVISSFINLTGGRDPRPFH